jgi:dynein intermediate chain
MPNAPEFVFTCETAISCATFYRYHPNIVIGGTYSGQIVIWDTRDQNKHPVQRTPINTRSHTHPIFGMRIVGSENSHNLITMDSNGKLCSWNLSRPSVDVPCRLNYPPDGMNLTIQTLSAPAPTTSDSTAMHSPQIIEEETSQDSYVSRPLTHSIAFPIDVDGQYLIGTETGSVYSGNYIDGLQSHYGLGHTAPVTGIDCHHYNRFSDLFLTSSIDYTCKLWSTKNAHPLYSFDYDDCVYDIKWSPTHPALFASVDGSGYLKVWNINRDTEVPQRSIQVCKHALNKLAFSQDGRRIVSGSIEGELQLFRLDDEWSGQVDNDESTLLERQLMFQ